MTSDSNPPPCLEAVAQYTTQPIRLDAAHPVAEWAAATPLTFCSDWQGRNPDPSLETLVRLLWNDERIYLRFECHYRELWVFDDSDHRGRRDHLWDRDVAEAFLQPDPSRPRFYKEIEISPNGMWIDLDISPAGLADLRSGLERSVTLDDKQRTWAAELAIPIAAFTSRFDADKLWRANFYRIEGRQEPRSYMTWKPTHSPQPNFHVPEAFGSLRFNK